MAGIYDEQILGAKQQAETARKLREGMTGPQGQMVSGWYVSPSITQYMADALKTYNAAKTEKTAGSEYEKLSRQKADETARLLKELEPRANVEVSPEMANAAYGQGDINSVMAQGPQTKTTYTPPDEQTRMSALMRGLSVNPEAFQPQMQMEQFNMGRADKRDAMQQAAELKREQMARDEALRRDLANQSSADRRYMADLSSKDRKSALDIEQPPKPAPGVRSYKDEQGQWKSELVEGSPQYQKVKAQYATDTAAVKTASADADKLVERARALKAHAGLPRILGVTGMIPNLPGGDAADAENLLNELKNTMQLAGFQNLRSTTGSPGVMTEREWPKMEAAISLLEKATSLKQAQGALDDIEIYANRIKKIANESYSDEWGNSQFSKQTGKAPPAADDPLGLR